ncbi:MAG: family 43 glycosylhydrolase [Deferribacteres bacterium]|nr:family 43 glycosylhydrolase [candidate division KSB1 bacterium]MCB9504321.1 family 43 glycosylhydrolase [Deferribacteres bacterium]
MSFVIFQLLLIITTLLSTGFPANLYSQSKTYCNPLNLDYAYNAIPHFTEWGKHRTTADPVIVLFQEKYFLFSTNQYGYWWSDDLANWNFIARRFLKPRHKVYDELCAPAAFAIGDTLFLIGSTHTKDFPLWMSTKPTTDAWTEAVDSFQVGAWDPAFFLDDDGRLYIYWGSSNTYPVYGQEIDRKTLQPIGEKQILIQLHDEVHGWERFGEHADNTFLAPFIEGAWMNKHEGIYYLQYAAPGTEFSGYGDGVYTSTKPLGPFTYQEHNPFAYKPGGFARGTGHGATFQDKNGDWWHVGTTVISVKNNFERRISLWPAGFDADGILYCNTAYGDYPHTLPQNHADYSKNQFTGWMLLNYNKPVQVSSTLGGYAPNFAVDENMKTYWSAVTCDSGEWLQSDLGSIATVRAIQINYADQGAELMGKQSGIFHKYVVSSSVDGKIWTTLSDKQENQKDVPHDYVELPEPVQARYLKITNLHGPTGTFALSGFRVFGHGNGSLPDTVKHFTVLRGESERRNAWLKWQASDLATGYTIYTGIASDKLYNSIMVYSSNEYYFTAMDRDRTYYFTIEAFNENGISQKTAIIESH